MHGAFGALRSLIGRGEQLAGGRFHRGGAVAHRFQNALDAVTEIPDRGIDRGAPVFLRHHGVALRLQLALLGDILMRRDPAAARHRLVHHVHDAAVARLDHPAEGFSLRDVVHDVANVLIDVAGEIACLLAVRDQLAQRAARLHDLGLEVVHRQIRPVAHHDAAGRIEHAQALRHVVERRHQVAAGLPHPDRVDDKGGEERARRCEQEVGGRQKLGHGIPGKQRT